MVGGVTRPLMRPIQAPRARGALRVAAGLTALALAVNLPSAESTPPPSTGGNPASVATPATALRLNELEYLEMPGLNVMLAHDYYPESHQGGVGIIQNGRRVATNGDLRLDRTPGQWQPVPKPGTREIDRAKGEVRVRMVYPDPEKNRRGFNPIEYPDLNFAYVVRVIPEPAGAAFRLVIDLESPLPAEWNGRVALNLEFFPGWLFGKSYAMDGQYGIFPRQANGPGAIDARGEFQIAALAQGKKLVIAPESDSQRLTIELLAGSGPLVEAEARSVLGQVAARQDRADLAQAHFERAAAQLTAIGADRTVAELWYELGACMDDLDMVAQARDAFRRAAASTGLVLRPGTSQRTDADVSELLGS